MSITNIIIITILIIILIWILSSTIFKTNIVMDLITECSRQGTINKSTNYSGSSSTNPNFIDKSIINSFKSQNMMLSMWFYIDMWDTNTSENNPKNILYIADGNVMPAQLDNVSINSSTLTDLSCVDRGNTYKNIAIELDNYENNLNIYVLCNNDNRCTTSTDLVMSKYKISNIPIQKWNNLTLSIDSKLLDIYLDGKLST